MAALFAASHARLAGLAAFVLGSIAILGALASEHIWGLVPCTLCLEQRIPYYWGLPILLLVLLLWARLPRLVRALALGLVVLLFAWGTGLGVYHAGVEWGFWPGPTSCTGTGAAISFDDLNNINAARIVPCDQVQFRFLGLSLAGYNALVALGVTLLSGIALVLGLRRNA
ncbi:disulfide bond formation protein B [Arsenicitalea aurantiaca]|uniref:Disulfide bond formation protein B n=1 Tax=Arsenicitalea aurantiaca TaxID=1783274 RepID=A0A433X5U0_9HYPH|nr:disulfide bond formation protein B [Arsenicitalea aurantiaca]RUT29407.1 disulfide bond formation protein B [Arsenicitalea aurantiaca]